MELYYGAYISQKVTTNLAMIKALAEKLELIPAGRESARRGNLFTGIPEIENRIP